MKTLNVAHFVMVVSSAHLAYFSHKLYGDEGFLTAVSVLSGIVAVFFHRGICANLLSENIRNANAKLTLIFNNGITYKFASKLTREALDFSGDGFENPKYRVKLASQFALLYAIAITLSMCLLSFILSNEGVQALVLYVCFVFFVIAILIYDRWSVKDQTEKALDRIFDFASSTQNVLILKNRVELEEVS